MTWRRGRGPRTAGSRESLRAGEVGGGRGLVGDGDHRRVQLAAARVGAPAPVVERREPGDADRDVALAVAPGAAERVGDDDRRRDAGQPRAARSARAEASGSLGQQDERAGSAAFDASTPAFAQTKPWRVRQISRRARRARARRLSASTTSTWRGSLPCSAASSRARSPGVDVGEPHDAALGLGDDLVRDDEHVAVARARRAAAASSAARSSPGRDLGQPARARRQSWAPSRGARPAPSSARVRAARRGGGRARGQRGEVVGRVDVERQRRHAATARRHAGGLRERRVALAAARAEGRRDRRPAA